MQLYTVNFILLLRSLYMFRVPYTPIIRSEIFQLYLQPLVQPLCRQRYLIPVWPGTKLHSWWWVYTAPETC